MPELLSEAVLLAALPIVAFVLLALALAVTVWALRRARRGPRAQARAAERLAQAGDRLVALDAALDDLDLTVGPRPATPTVRRARMTAQHARDELYGEYREAVTGDLQPTARAHAAERITGRATAVLDTLARAAAAHRHDRESVVASDRLADARERLASLHGRMGDPTALVADLRARFDERECADAAEGAAAAIAAAEQAAAALDAAEVAQARGDGLDLASVDHAMRQADRAFRVVDESYRLVIQSAAAVDGEISAVQATLQQALRLRETLDPVQEVRRRDRIDRARVDVGALDEEASRRPTQTVVAVARVQERIDEVLEGTRTAQQRTRAARLALAGTLAAARILVVHAEAQALRSTPSAQARAAVWEAERHLGAARSASDPAGALATARRALAAAGDAAAGPGE